MTEGCDSYECTFGCKVRTAMDGCCAARRVTTSLMRRFRPLDVLLTASVVVALVIAAYALRYGDTYTIGDTQLSRSTGNDVLAVVLPLLWSGIATFVLLVRRSNLAGFIAEVRRE